MNGSRLPRPHGLARTPPRPGRAAIGLVMLMFHHAGGPGVAGLLTVGAAAMLAAAAQAISGFGMNLILAPAAQLTLPGAAAVRLVAGTGAILNSGLLAAGRRSVLWRPALHLLAPAMAATFLLGPVIPRASAGLVSVLVAVVTILALAASASAALPPRLTGGPVHSSPAPSRAR